MQTHLVHLAVRTTISPRVKLFVRSPAVNIGWRFPGRVTGNPSNTTLEEGGTKIVKYSYATGKVVDTLLNLNQIKISEQ